MASFIEAGGSLSMIAQIPESALGPRALAAIRVPIGRLDVPFKDVLPDDLTDADFAPLFGIEIVRPPAFAPRAGGFPRATRTVSTRASFWLDGLTPNGAAAPPTIHYQIRRLSGDGATGGPGSVLIQGSVIGDAVPTWTSTGLIAHLGIPIGGRLEFWAVVAHEGVGPAAVTMLASVNFDRLTADNTIPH